MTDDPTSGLWHLRRLGNPLKALELSPCRSVPGNPVHVAGPDCLTFDETVRLAAELAYDGRATRVRFDPDVAPGVRRLFLDAVGPLEVLVAIYHAGGEPWREEP